MVDPELYYRENNIPMGWLPELDLQTPMGRHMEEFASVSVKSRPDDKQPLQVNKFSNDYCFLLNDWILGFTLSTRGHRKWG